MIDKQDFPNKAFRIIIILLGIFSFIGIAGYGLTYIFNMPDISPDKFVPKTIEPTESTGFGFGNILAVFILIYAFALLPVVVLFTTKKYKTNPYAMVIAGSLIVVSLFFEIFNNLPLIGLTLVNINLGDVPPETLLYIRQTETIRYLSFDVAGFTLMYLGFFIYAIIFYKTIRFLSSLVIVSIVLFLANVPFLWVEPKIAIILMVISILAFALVPIIMVKMIINQPEKT